MIRYVSWLLMLALTGAVHAEDPAAPDDGTKALSGMSILGNSEAPKSLVIVPWKTSEIGDGVGVANLLDGRPRPVDRDVFMRELAYYELLTGGSSESAEAASADPANAVAK